MIALAAKRPLAGGFTRRGACPALSAPMATGDGLLVRLNSVAGGLSPAQLAGLCDAAETHGNGVIEVTARGSIQLRGLTERSAAEFALAVNELGIAVRTGVPVVTGVLAGVDPDEIADPTPLAEGIRTGIAKAGLEARLGPKVSVVVDGGGRTALDEVAADVRLTAVGSDYWHVAIAGDARTARPSGTAKGDGEAHAAALAILSQIADAGREARARDLDDSRLKGWRSTLPPSGPELVEGPAISPSRGEITPSYADPSISGVAREGAAAKPLISPLEGEMAGRPEGGAKERDSARSLIGITSLRDGQVAIGIALPFGHTTAKPLKTFAEMAEALGVADIRPAPRRTLVAICQLPAQAETLRKQAETLDFVTSPGDPRQAISACPGAPECASGHIPARRLAAEIAKKYSDLLDGSVHLHVSGCAKGCAHPAASDLTLVGSGDGIGLVAGGTARDKPAAVAENDGAGRAPANVATLLSAERQPGETTAQAVQRLGLSALAEAFQQGEK
jgi:precorrin-3B synthase